MATVIAGTPAKADFQSCKRELKAEAIRNGVSEATATAAFDDLTADPKVLELERFQPEFKTPIWDYLSALVDDERVSDGKAAMVENAEALSLAEGRFGVSKYILAAIWGVESNFGRNMGDRPLVQSLSTLACSASRRPQYFRGELLAALKIVNRGDVPLAKLRGSWAGAFGQTQFMPSSFLRFAVDLKGSGRDIIDSSAAALASTANYLKSAGWTAGEPWGYEVRLPPDYDGPSGRSNRHPASFWVDRGVKRMGGGEGGGGMTGLLLPAGRKGPAFLVTHNFDVILRYNSSESYALAAGILAQRLANGAGIVAPWPTDDPGLSRAERRELQELLAKQGYDVGSPDGAIGQRTQAAIADFQEKVGLAVNGRASRKVLERLRSKI